MESKIIECVDKVLFYSKNDNIIYKIKNGKLNKFINLPKFLICNILINKEHIYVNIYDAICIYSISNGYYIMPSSF